MQEPVTIELKATWNCSEKSAVFEHPLRTPETTLDFSLRSLTADGWQLAGDLTR